MSPWVRRMASPPGLARRRRASPRTRRCRGPRRRERPGAGPAGRSPTPSSSTGPPSGQRREPLGAGVDVGHVAVPVVVDVGEPVAVGRRVVALHAQQCGGSDGLGLRRRSRPGRTGRWTGPPPTPPSRRPARRGHAVAVGRARRGAAGAPAAGARSDDDVGPPRRRLHDPKRAPATIIGLTACFVIPHPGARRVPRPRRRGLRPRRAARRRRTRPSTSAPTPAAGGRGAGAPGRLDARARRRGRRHRPPGVGLVRRPRPHHRRAPARHAADRVAAVRVVRARAPARGACRSSASGSCRSP